LEAAVTSQSLWDTEPVEEPALPETSGDTDFFPVDSEEPEEPVEEFPDESEAVVAEETPEPPAPVVEISAGPQPVAPPELPTEPEADVVTINSDEFTALEERILRTVNLVKRERSARQQAEEHTLAVEARLAEAQEQLKEEQSGSQHLKMELQTLRGERDHVKQRVERLLSQLDALEM
jgi:hypothetical protein